MAAAKRIGRRFKSARGPLRTSPNAHRPNERDGHPDHDAIGQTCLRFARVHKLPIARYPIWAWHHRQPHDFEGARFGRFALDTATQAAKADAIDCFTSQLALRLDVWRGG